jgi:glycosyltransferase involved in cell wall biosynthesis
VKLSFTVWRETSISPPPGQRQGVTGRPCQKRESATMPTTGIALCITDLRPGGAERCLLELAAGLDRRRFEPVVYSLEPPPETEGGGPILRGLEAAGIEVHCLGARRGWEFPRVVGRLTRLLGGQRPRVVQTLLFHANIVGRIAARRAGVPVVVSGIRVGEPRRRWRLWADWLTEGMVDRHVCVSDSVAQFARTAARLPAEKLVVIPNGVDLRRHPAQRRADLQEVGIAPGRRVVSCVGRLEPQKGHAWLIRSSPAWLGRLPDTDLLLVGEGPLRRSLERLCRQCGVSDRVRFAGWRGDVPEVLAASDLLVLPSAWEGMPKVLLEAMASRLAVVATDVEGVRELLGPAAEEQMVRYGDSAALAERIVRLLEDRTRAAELGGENRGRAEQRFSIAAMVGAYQGLWESLLGG